MQNRFNAPLATSSTPNHSLHRNRRAALNPFFSKRKISEHVPVVQSRVEHLCDRISNEYAGTSRILVLSDAWGCLTSDTVVGYCFERSYNFLDMPDFKAPFPIAVEALVNAVHYATQFPWISTVMQWIPDSVIAILSPPMKSVISFDMVYRLLISRYPYTDEYVRK